MISLFRPKKKNYQPLLTDLHSHLLPELDDGVKSWTESLELIHRFAALGYKKIITTPHINSEYYRNEPAPIKAKLSELNERVKLEKIDVVVEAAAEYYLDEELLRKVQNKEPLITFSKSNLLFETNFLTEPYQLKDFIFQVFTQGYKPTLAHPERYAYMTLDKANDMRDRGVLLQTNTLSILGYYGRPIQQLAHKLIDHGLVDILGSDCHNPQHMAVLEKAFENKYYRKALELPLINNSL